MGSWWFVGVVLVGVLIPWPYCPFDLTGPNRYEPPGGDPSSLSHWQSGRSIQDRSVHTLWVILDWIRLTLSYVPSLSLTDPNPLMHIWWRIRGEGTAAGWLIPLFSCSLVVTSSLIALNDACPKLVGWYLCWWLCCLTGGWGLKRFSGGALLAYWLPVGLTG